jgi:hypothetical protein
MKQATLLLVLFVTAVFGNHDNTACEGEDLLSNQACKPADRLRASYERAESDNGVTAQFENAFPGILNITALNETFTYLGDLFPKVAKITHSVGAVGTVEITWCENQYSGLFKGKQRLFTRFSSGAGPITVNDQSVDFFPNIAFKQFRKDTHSGTLQFATGFTGVNTTSFFIPYSNHLLSTGSFIEQLFAQVAPATATGLCDFAQFNSNGMEVEHVKCPWALVIQPNPVVAERFDQLNTSFISQLNDNINIDDEIFKIYFVNRPPFVDPVTGNVLFFAPTFAGTIVLKDKLIPSLWGDGQTEPGIGGGFFVNHKSFAQDFVFNPSFEPAYYATKQYEHVYSYLPLLPLYSESHCEEELE